MGIFLFSRHIEPFLRFVIKEGMTIAAIPSFCTSAILLFYVSMFLQICHEFHIAVALHSLDGMLIDQRLQLNGGRVAIGKSEVLYELLL